MAEELPSTVANDVEKLKSQVEDLRNFAMQSARQTARTYGVQLQPTQPTIIKGVGWQPKRKRYIGDGRTVALIGRKGAEEATNTPVQGSAGGSTPTYLTDVVLLTDPSVLRFYVSDGTTKDIDVAECPPP